MSARRSEDVDSARNNEEGRSGDGESKDARLPNRESLLLSTAIIKSFLSSVIVSEIAFNTSPAFIFAMFSKVSILEMLEATYIVKI